MGKTAIIGFGCAGYHAAKALREVRPEEEIDVYSDVTEPLTNPMLTTYYVAGKIPRKNVFPYGDASERAAEIGVRLHMGVKVEKLRAAERVLMLDDGRELVYDDVVLATGSHPLVPPIPGLPDHGIYVMRTVADADKLLSAINEGIGSALVIGASWVGIKVVEALYAHKVPTILADMAPRIFATATLPDTADVIHRRLLDMGVGLKFGSGIASVCADGDEIVSSFADGTEIRTDIVALCLGLRPTSDLLDPAELEMGRGVRTDMHMRSSVPHIYAAGDIAEVAELTTRQPMGVLTWANASRQGTVAGHNIGGVEDEFEGNFLHNITHFLDMDFIGMGDNRAQGEHVSFVSREGWRFEAIVADEHPACINILDNRSCSGPAKSAVIRLLKQPDVPLTTTERYALKKAGLPEKIINRLEVAVQ